MPCANHYNIAQLEQKVNELEARLNRHSGNSSQPPSQDPPQAAKNQREKSVRHPANLDIRETIGNWNRLRKWIRSWSIGRKPALTDGVCWLRLREDNFLPWSNIKYGSCQKFTILLIRPHGLYQNLN